jgi:hypothetical protein
MFKKATVGYSSSIGAGEKCTGGEEQVMMGEEQMAVEAWSFYVLVSPPLFS